MDTEFSVKLRMEKISKSQLFITVCVFFFGFLTCVLIALLLAPAIINNYRVDIYKCQENKHENCYRNTTTHEVWEGKIPHVGRLNQLLYMTAQAYSVHDQVFNMSMEILVKHKNEVVADNDKELLITCKSGICNTIVIFYLPYLDYESYDVLISHKSPILADMVELNLSCIDADFTKYQLLTKYAFFVLSLASLVQFLIYSKKIPFRLWSFEAKCLLPLGISLILFNEPLLWVTIYFMNPFWSGVSVFCTTQFIAILIIFWFSDLQHYRNSSFNLSMVIFEGALVGGLFGLIFNAYLYVHEKLRFDPTYDWNHDLNHKYKEIFAAILGMIVLVILWLIYLSGKAITNIKRLSQRERTMKVLNVFFIVFVLVGIAFGAFQSVPRYSSILLMFEAGFNLYVILLQIMYSPTMKSILEYENDKKIAYSLVQLHESENLVELT